MFLHLSVSHSVHIYSPSADTPKHTLPGQTPHWAHIPLADTPSRHPHPRPNRRVLLRMVRILLECIIVGENVRIKAFLVPLWSWHLPV